MAMQAAVVEPAQSGTVARRRSTAEYIQEMKCIGGWLTRADASCFVQVDEVQKSSGVVGDLVEIGVWHGRGAILFHHLLRGDERVFAVDIFDLRDRDHPYFNDPAILRQNAAAFGCDDRLELVRMDTSREGHRLLEVMRRPVRLLHIDGGHDYEVVRRDIEIARRLLGEGAVLVFDDFFNRRHPGTTQAIMEFLLSSPGFSPFLITGKKLWICGSDRHAAYFRQMKTAKVATRQTNLFRRRVLVATA